jgi:hypothetical protein
MYACALRPGHEGGAGAHTAPQPQGEPTSEESAHTGAYGSHKHALTQARKGTHMAILVGILQRNQARGGGGSSARTRASVKAPDIQCGVTILSDTK